MQILFAPVLFAIAIVSAVQTSYNYNEAVSCRSSCWSFVASAILSSCTFTVGLCIIAKSFAQ